MDPAPGNHLQAVKIELNRLETYRRRTYLGVLALTVAIMMLSWAFREQGDPFITIAYPVFSVADPCSSEPWKSPSLPWSVR